MSAATVSVGRASRHAYPRPLSVRLCVLQHNRARHLSYAHSERQHLKDDKTAALYRRQGRNEGSGEALRTDTDRSQSAATRVRPTTIEERSRYSRVPVTPNGILDQLRTESPVPPDILGGNRQYDLTLHNTLETIQRTLGPNEAYLLSNLSNVLNKPEALSSDQVRADLAFNACVDRYIKKAARQWIERLSTNLAQHTGRIHSDDLPSTDRPLDVLAPHQLVRQLQEWRIITPARRADVLYFSLLSTHFNLQRISRLKSTTSSAIHGVLAEIASTWHAVLAPTSHISTSKPSGVLDWSFLPSPPPQASDDGTSADLDKFIRSLLPPPAAKSERHSPEFASAAWLTLYLDRRVKRRAAVYNHTAAPLLTLLEGAFKAARPVALPLRLDKALSRHQPLLDGIKQALCEPSDHPVTLLPQQSAIPTKIQTTSITSANETIAEASSLVDQGSGASDAVRSLQQDIGRTTEHCWSSKTAIPDKTVDENNKTVSSTANTRLLQAQSLIKRAGRAADKHDVELAESLWRKVSSLETRAQGHLPQAVYESIMRMFSEVARPVRVLEVLQHMDRIGVKPDKKSWTTAIRASIALKKKDLVDSLWSLMLRQGIEPDAQAWSARIFALINVGSPQAAMSALQELSFAQAQQWKQEAGASINAQSPEDENFVSLTTIDVANSALSALAAQPGRSQYMSQVLAWIEKLGLKPDIRTYNIFINAAMRKSAPKKAFQVIEDMRKEGIVPDATTATIIITALFHTNIITQAAEDDESTATYLLEMLDDIEDNHVGTSMNAKGYATALNWAAKKSYPTTCQALLERMRSRSIPTSSFTYTILMDLYLNRAPPMYDAFESLWTTIQFGDGGWGLALDPIFCQRALERFGDHHRALGLDKIEWLLRYMIRHKTRPSWPALQGIARVYHEREDWKTLSSLVDDIRHRRGVAADGFSGSFGQNYFWGFILSTGILRKSGFTTTAELMMDQSPQSSSKAG